jgi:AhpD family alkylhydroperoxidase
MSEHFYDESDLDLLQDMCQAAPNEFKAWLDLDKVTARTDGAIPRKYRELIAVAVAHATQCVYCIKVHTQNAKRMGATKAELAEAVFISAAIRAGGAAAHGTIAMKYFDKA